MMDALRLVEYLYCAYKGAKEQKAVSREAVSVSGCISIRTKAIYSSFIHSWQGIFFRLCYVDFSRYWRCYQDLSNDITVHLEHLMRKWGWFIGSICRGFGCWNSYRKEVLQSPWIPKNDLNTCWFFLLPNTTRSLGGWWEKEKVKK